MRRRKFIKNSLFGMMGAGLYTWQVEPFWVDFVYKKMHIKHLPKKLIGKTIMQISDLHISKKIDLAYLVRAMQKAQKLKPDFVVYTGDFLDYTGAKQFSRLQEVMKKATKGSIATLGVLGNHDYGHRWNDAKAANQVSKILRSCDIHILRNQIKRFQGLNFIGIDDYWGTNFHPSKVTKQIHSKAANLVLCHNPDVCDLKVWNNYQGWILSGHTHGGQCKPPFLPPPILPVKNKKYSSGTIDLNDGRTLYINKGLGCSSLQVRFNVRPEVTVFTLRKDYEVNKVKLS